MELIIGLILTALLFLFLEIFLPGGILGLVGICLIVLSSALTYSDYGMSNALIVLFGGLSVAFIFFLLEMKLLSSGPFSKLIRLDATISSSTNPADKEELIGKDGVSLTTMAPEGKVRVEGVNYTASALEGYLSKGTQINVIRAEPFKLIVTKK